MRISLQARVLFYVQKNGTCTTAEIVSGVGKYVTAVQAIRAHERLRRSNGKKRGTPKIHRKMDPIRSGKTIILSNSIKNLMNGGFLVRISRAVYAYPNNVKEKRAV